MKTLKFGLKALSLVLVPVLLSSSLYADDLVSRKVAEFQGDVENIRKELETAKTQMKRLDYGKIEGILAEICAKLDSSLQPEKTEHEATVILAEVNGLLRDIRPMMEESLPVETRGIWVDNVTMRQLRSRKDVEEFFADMASINVNFVIVDAFNEGAATYPSKVAPEHPESQMYGGDKLRDIVEIAHSKNIEVHALITTFGIGRAGIAHFLDEKMSWLDKHKDGKYDGTGGTYWLSPALPEVREYLLSILKELVGEYNVDGVQLDYVRYDFDFGYHEYSRELFQKLFGIDPLDIKFEGDQNNFILFKTQFVTSFVERAFFELKAIKPDVLLSAAALSPYTWYKLTLGQDWAGWAYNRNISFVCPMSYTADLVNYQNLALSELRTLKGTSYAFTGLGAHLYDENALRAQIAAGRATPIGGQVIFSTYNLTASDKAMLKAGVWMDPAFPTFRDPRKAAYMMLTDLTNRIKEFEPHLGAEQALLSGYLAHLGELQEAVSQLEIRDWDTRNPREGSEKEVTQLEPILAYIKEMESSVREDVNQGRIASPSGERILLDLSKITNLLEPLLYTATPFTYVQTTLP